MSNKKKIKFFYIYSPDYISNSSIKMHKKFQIKYVLLKKDKAYFKKLE